MFMAIIKIVINMIYMEFVITQVKQEEGIITHILKHLQISGIK